jgi:hypothetical protein
MATKAEKIGAWFKQALCSHPKRFWTFDGTVYCRGVAVLLQYRCGRCGRRFS